MEQARVMRAARALGVDRPWPVVARMILTNRRFKEAVHAQLAGTDSFLGSGSPAPDPAPAPTDAAAPKGIRPGTALMIGAVVLAVVILIVVLYTKRK